MCSEDQHFFSHYNIHIWHLICLELLLLVMLFRRFSSANNCASDKIKMFCFDLNYYSQRKISYDKQKTSTDVFTLLCLSSASQVVKCLNRFDEGTFSDSEVKAQGRTNVFSWWPKLHRTVLTKPIKMLVLLEKLYLINWYI